MKVNELNATASIIGRINIGKISDKELRTSIFKNFVALKKALADSENNAKELSDKMFKGHDLEAHNALVAKIQEAERNGKGDEAKRLIKKLNPDTIKAIRKYNETLENLQKDEAKVELTKIDTETFLDAMNEQDFTLSVAELDVLTSMLK